MPEHIDDRPGGDGQRQDHIHGRHDDDGIAGPVRADDGPQVGIALEGRSPDHLANHAAEG